MGLERPRPIGKWRPGWGLLALLVLVLQAACVTPSGSMRGGQQYRYSNAPGASVDSATASCRHSPSACLAAVGKEVASVAAVTKVLLDETAQHSIEEKLAECADLARSEVLLRYPRQFRGPTPDADECKQETTDRLGRRVTWAMRLGTEMHEVAQQCTEAALKDLRPGGFSLEQRYRYDSDTGQWKLVSADQERLLEETGNGGELMGTLKPDVVIHPGDPLMVQAVYDFKFPCANMNRVPEWGKYPEDHPYAEYTQGQVYQRLLAPIVARLVPRWGVIHE
jgi:hypothetical protein